MKLFLLKVQFENQSPPAGVERAIRNWRDQCRTLQHQFERRLRTKLSPGSAMSTWLVTWAADVIDKYRVRYCGKTSFEKMTHRRCRHLAIRFAEKVYFLHTTIEKDSYRKDVGI